MTANNEAAATAATILGALGEAGTKLGASGGAFGTVATIAGGALSLASLLTLAFGTEMPITIPELKDGLARMDAENVKVDTWARDTLKLDLNAPLELNDATIKKLAETLGRAAAGAKPSVTLPDVGEMVERARLAHRFNILMAGDMAAARRAVLALEAGKL